MRAWSWLWLCGACAAVPLSLWQATHERFIQSAANVVVLQANASDLVLVSRGVQPRGALDIGALMRPLGALAPLVVDPAGLLPDVASLPQRRVFLVGPGLETLAAQLHQPQRLNNDVVMGAPGEGDTPINLLPHLSIHVARDGVLTPCTTAAGATGGKQCGPQPWQHVAPAVVEANNQQVACLWAHPVSGAEMRVTLPATIHSGTVWMQYAQEALKDPPHTPVSFSAWRGAQLVSTVDCTNQGTGRCILELNSSDASDPWELRWSTADAARQLMCLGGRLHP